MNNIESAWSADKKGRLNKLEMDLSQDAFRMRVG